MGRLLRKQDIRDLLLGAGLLLSAAALLLWPEQAVTAARDGLRLCGNVIVPSLFPFFVLSSLVVELGLSRYLGRLFQRFMVPLFRVNGACASALALGFVGGYPVGARTAIALYRSGQCTKTETERLLAFCNNSGPAFIFGVVGAGIFHSGPAGLLLYLTHVAASLAVGLLFRFYKPHDGPASPRGSGSVQFQTGNAGAAFTRSVTGALSGILNICAFVICFTVILRLLTLCGALDLAAEVLAFLFRPLGMDRIWARRLLTGVVELSSGVTALSGGAISGRLSMAAFMLGWAGLSVHCQVLAFLGDSGLSMGTYLSGKLLHGILSAALLRLLMPLLKLAEPADSCLSLPVSALSALDFSRCLALSTGIALGTCAAIVLLCLTAVKKSGGKIRRKRV